MKSYSHFARIFFFFFFFLISLIIFINYFKINEKLLNSKYNHIFYFKYIIKKLLKFTILIILNLKSYDKFLIINFFFNY